VNDLDVEGVWKNYDGSDLNLYDFMFNYVTEGSENGMDALTIVPTENCIWRERREYSDLLKMLCEKNISKWMFVCLLDDVQRNFQQYFSYIVAVSFIGGNRSTRRKPPTCHKSLTNFITCYTPLPDRGANSQHQW